MAPLTRFHHAFALVAAATILAGTATEATGELVAIDLHVRPGFLNTVDGREIPALCYSLDETGPATLPAPILTLSAGDELEVTVSNHAAEPHGLEIVGIGGEDSVVEPGGTEIFRFTFFAAGTWLYRDPVNHPVNQGVGLAGLVEVSSADTTYDAEFAWLLGDHSEEWMARFAAGQPVNTATYNPNYFTINGLSGTATNSDPRAHIVGRVGDELLIRVVNGGLRLHSLHFHGYHVDVIARDGQPLPSPLQKDTVAVPAGGTAEFVLRPHQPGVFPIHDHVVLSVTGNGVYPLGMIAFTDIQE